MNTRNQLLAVAATILFAIALALTVTIISLSTVRTSVRDAIDPPKGGAGTSAIPVVAASEPDPEPVADAETTTAEPENSLRYESLGNGTCAVAGIGGLRDACVIIPEVSPTGERVVRVSARAFLGCGQITAVQIPASVREIGALAFADCPNLVYLSVSAANPYFRDAEGVLFTADGHTLIQYPTMRAGNAVIPATVNAVCEMAFYRCANLKTVRYEGTPEEWDRVTIAPRNYSLFSASVEFAGE